MITPISIISVLPETHAIVNVDHPNHQLRLRIDHKSKEYISVNGDDSHLEWRVTKCHQNIATCASAITNWMSSQHFNVTIFVTVPDGLPIMGKLQISMMESICAPFLVTKPACDMCASSWKINGGYLQDILQTEHDTVSGIRDEGELVPETDSVRIRTPLDFQRLARRLEHSVEQKAIVFVRFVNFTDNRILHFIFANSTDAVRVLGVIPQARTSRKSGAPIIHPLKGLTERCLVPLLAGNAKPFLIIDATEVNETNITVYQSLFDLGEKMCITALPCESELSLRMEDFEIIDSIDKLPPFKKVEQKQTPHRVSVHLDDAPARKSRPKPISPPKIIENVVVPEKDEMSEIDELKAQNLILKCEVDRLNAAKASSSEGGTNAYTTHLVAEVKQLRQELLQVETEKRKYETSKRLLDSLIEKSNKLKTESASRAAKIEELRKQESVLKTELSQLKQNCEYLLQENKQLNIQLEQRDSAARTNKGEVSVESFYHEFLFPFNRKESSENR